MQFAKHTRSPLGSVALLAIAWLAAGCGHSTAKPPETAEAAGTVQPVVSNKIKSLEAKRNELKASMDSLLDAARASGIEPGQLR